MRHRFLLSRYQEGASAPRSVRRIMAAFPAWRMIWFRKRLRREASMTDFRHLRRDTAEHILDAQSIMSLQAPLDLPK